MGAFGKDTPRLLWLCVFATFFLILLDRSVDQVSAESKIDSDLVFENLEQTDLSNHENHHRIARDSSSSEEISLESSPPVEEHWLSSTVNRIKRHINNLLSTKSKVSHKRTKRKFARIRREGSQQEADEDYDEDEEDTDDYDDANPTTADVDNEYDGEDNDNGKTQYKGEEEDDDQNYNDEDEDEEEYDDNDNGEDAVEQELEEGDEDLIPEPTPAAFPTETEETGIDEHPQLAIPVPNHSEDRNSIDLLKPDDNYNYSVPSGRNETGFGSDDEDDNLITSGEGSTDSTPSPLGPFGPDDQTPVYYRISFTVSEPYVEEFGDRNSFKYRDFSEELVKEIDTLYLDTPGTQTAAVIKIERREADAFTSKVTIDLGSDGYRNNKAIKDTLFRHIESNHRLGKFTVLPDDFNFRVFEDQHTTMCGVNQIPCHSGECVPSEARCNKTYECLDRSDEAGCPVDIDIASPPTTLSSPSSTSSIIEPELGSGEVGSVGTTCRADDAVRCEDGSRTICADQVCDGIKDCDNGGDEENCLSSIDCAETEYVCDVSRCIPLNKRCDGVKDCSDETDERDCVECPEGDLICDNTCIPPNKRCDGTPDCSNGQDESNCPPEAQCRPDQFSCGDGQCIAGQQRCDRQQDCRNGQDEYNCTTPCGDDQFTCLHDGNCIPLSAKCDEKYDCEDLSDERNCPCKPTDFKCANGVCIPHHQRCNGINNCQDRSDEIGCPGSSRPDIDHEPPACTPDEFRCRDGSCVSLSKRCDGRSDCLHAEDEESCALCKTDQFKCASGDCIDANRKCDGSSDCPDGSDESSCNGKDLTCIPNAWKCFDKSKCIKDSSYCDGIQDCQDNSDERFCSQPSKIVIKGKNIAFTQLLQKLQCVIDTIGLIKNFFVFLGKFFCYNKSTICNTLHT